jgi:hypothetical protein
MKVASAVMARALPRRTAIGVMANANSQILHR